MKVTVKDNYLNVRIGKPSVNAPCHQYIAPGSIIDVDGKLYKGDKYGESDIDTWLKDEANNYYWSGGVTDQIDITEVLNSSTPKLAKTINFDWFNSLGINAVWEQYKEKGNAVTIAVLDTGYDTNNPEINIAIKGEKIIIGSDNYPGINLTIKDQSNDGHGNRCASLIGARNKLQWNLGIAPECKLVLGKISINREIRDFEYIIKGIEWALAQGADVISISYAVELTPADAIFYNTKFEALLSGKSVLVFAAAGNSDGSKTFGERYPASFPKCISVGATNELGKFSFLTILSDKTILHAPGINIESLGRKSTPDKQSGTSFSTPIVAAVAGLAISFLKKKGVSIDVNNLINKLISSGDNIEGNLNKKNINVVKLFNQL